MKNFNKHILEAVNRGIKLALDDFDDEAPISQSISKVKSKDLTSEWLDLLNNFVDLGLPSGTLWAKYNLGCDWDKLNKEPFESTVNDWVGNHYAWGEIKPKRGGTWDNYKFTPDGDDSNIIKYNLKDGLGELLPEDNAAYQINHNFRIPTYEQCKELSDNTYSMIVQNYNPRSNCFKPNGNNNGVELLDGFVIISKINRKHIFVPYTWGMDASFWSSTLTKQKPKCQTACFMSMSKDWQSGHCYTANSDRCNNMPIRPVLNQ